MFTLLYTANPINERKENALLKSQQGNTVMRSFRNKLYEGLCDRRTF